MSKKFLLSLIVVLIITNIMTLLFWGGSDDNSKYNVELDDDAQTQVNSKDPVATVGKEDVSYADWVNSIRNTYGHSHLKSMIDRSVVSQLSKQEGISIDEKIIERDIAFLTSMQGVKTAEEITKQEAHWRDDIVYRYELETLLTKDVTIPEDEIQTYFNRYKAQYNFDTSIQLSHIIVDTFDIAEKVIMELEQGASFDLLAKEYSNDSETKGDGGYLGFLIEDSQFIPHGYVDLIKNMTEDTYSEPFKSKNEVAIVYFHRKLPEITFTYDEMKPYIENELALNEMEQSLSAEPLWEQLNIEWIYDKE